MFNCTHHDIIGYVGIPPDHYFNIVLVSQVFKWINVRFHFGDRQIRNDGRRVTVDNYRDNQQPHTD